MNDLSDRLDALVIMALLSLLGFALWALVFVNIPEKNETLFAAVVGTVLGGGLGAYIQYRWGSSKGSQAKDATIANLTAKVPDQ